MRRCIVKRGRRASQASRMDLEAGRGAERAEDRGGGLTLQVNHYLTHAGASAPPASPLTALPDAREREEISRGIARGDSYHRIARRRGAHHDLARGRRCGGGAATRHSPTRRPGAGPAAEAGSSSAARARRIVVERLRQTTPAADRGLASPPLPDMRGCGYRRDDLSLALRAVAGSSGASSPGICAAPQKRLPRSQSARPGPGQIATWFRSPRPAGGRRPGRPRPLGGRPADGDEDERDRHLGRALHPLRQLVALPVLRRRPGQGGARPKRRTLPSQLRRSLTWDQGLEMAEHARFTVDSGVEVYFCDPEPLAAGIERDTNGLLRQYFPKGRSPRG